MATKKTGLSDDQVNNIVRSAVKDAVDFVEENVAPARQRAKQYFEGGVTLGHEEGRSKVVATKVRDTIRAIKPALMRVFLQSGDPAEFEPNNPQAVKAAEQATNYASYIFRKNAGFDLLNSVVHDALLYKTGIAKVFFEENEDVQFDEYTNVSEEVLVQLELEGAEIVELEAGSEEGFFNAKVSKVDKEGEIRIASIPPEDFFVDGEATSIRDFYVCGNKSVYRVSDLVEMGFDFDEVLALAGSTDSELDQEEDLARGKTLNDDNQQADPSMRKVLFTEAYMRMDIEGTGVAKMYKFVCAGTNYKVLDKEPCDFVPYAVFEVDPEPHAFFGRSLAEIIEEDQNAATALLRGLLDSVNDSLTPKTAVDENTVNLEDVMNNEIGAIWRVRGTPQGAIMPVSGSGNGAAVALPAMQFFDEAVRTKTGVTGAGMGMDADALQSQTAAGVNAAVQAASAVSELIARTLAEGGMCQMFKLIAEQAHAHPDRNEMMRVNGEFVEVDPSSWGTGLDLKTNVGLGHNKHDERIMTLDYVINLQTQAIMAQGPQNGLVSLTNLRNAVADRMKYGGLHNADRYLMPMNPQIEQQMMAQQAQAAQQAQGSDPNAAFMQVEQMKAQMRAQADMAKVQADKENKMREFAIKVAELQGKNDLKRDEMAQNLAIEAAKLLGEYDLRLDQNAIQREQATNNQMNGAFYG